MLEALPEGFDFYHLGRIELDQSTPVATFAVSSDQLAVAYRLQGDVRGALILIFGREHDASVYSEAGNVIASRLATELSSRRGFDVAISPPQRLTSRQLQPLLQSGGAIARTYVHRHGSSAVKLTAVLLSSKETLDA